MTKEELDYVESGQRQHFDVLQHQEKMNFLVEQSEYGLFALLKPSIKIDGDMWCVLLGENLQDGIAGFGTSPEKAIREWNKQFYSELGAQK